MKAFFPLCSVFLRRLFRCVAIFPIFYSLLCFLFPTALFSNLFPISHRLIPLSATSFQQNSSPLGGHTPSLSTFVPSFPQHYPSHCKLISTYILSTVLPLSQLYWRGFPLPFYWLYCFSLILLSVPCSPNFCRCSTAFISIVMPLSHSIIRLIVTDLISTLVPFSHTLNPHCGANFLQSSSRKATEWRVEPYSPLFYVIPIDFFPVCRLNPVHIHSQVLFPQLVSSQWYLLPRVWLSTVIRHSHNIILHYVVSFPLHCVAYSP